MNAFAELVIRPEFGYAVLRVTTPLLFATLGALISDKAGAINIALEGIMLVAALSAVIASAASGSALLGLAAALCSGALIGLALGYFVMYLKAHVILSGIAINVVASGGTIFILSIVAGDKGISSSLPSRVLPRITIPGLDAVPGIGAMLSGHNVLTYVALVSVPLLWFFLYKTPTGLRLRAVGEHEEAADSVGLGVTRIRYLALMMSGVFAAFGGAYMSMGYVSWFSRNMTAGRGFIALAAEAMGGATVVGSLITSLLFGFFDALSNALQFLDIPSQLVAMMPYLAIVLGLVIYAMRKKERERRVLRGVPYSRERKGTV